MKEEYPKWIYKPTGESVVTPDVGDHLLKKADGYITAEEYDALSVPAVNFAPELVGAEPLSLAPVVFEALKASDAIGLVTKTDDADLLVKWRFAEENREGGARKTVLNAFADKLGVLAVPAASGQ